MFAIAPTILIAVRYQALAEAETFYSEETGDKLEGDAADEYVVNRINFMFPFVLLSMAFNYIMNRVIIGLAYQKIQIT